MAVVEIWDVRGRFDHPLDYVTNDRKTVIENLSDEELGSLQDVIRYATNNEKTSHSDYQVYVSGVNCNVKEARRQMSAVRKGYSDKSEIIAFHGFQSFAHGEVTPDTAHDLGVKFAERMWGDRFQVVVATHLNTKSIHNHYVINGTSFVDGKRFYDNKKYLQKARDTSDALCKEYGLSVIENPSGHRAPYHLYKAEQAGMPTRMNVARQAIDEAISLSRTKDEFFKTLNKLGYMYDFRESRKYATVTPKGYGKPLRIHRIGEEYTRERIYERIEENRLGYKPVPLSPPVRQSDYRNVTAYSYFIAQSKGGLRGLYLHYCYRLGILPKNTQRNNARLHPLLKEDLLKLNRITKEVRFLYRHKIDTVEQLQEFKSEAESETETLKKLRQRLWNRTRNAEPADVDEIKKEIAVCSEQLKVLRNDLRCADGVLHRSLAVAEKMSNIENEERSKHESFRRRR